MFKNSKGGNTLTNFETKLSKQDEEAYKRWFSEAKEGGLIHPEDNGYDYDFRGFWKDFIKTGRAETFNQETHFPDLYKKPNHETFSVESKYAVGVMKKYAGSWNGETFIEPAQRYRERTAEDWYPQMNGKTKVK
jgi:hypothetical protein